MTVHVINGEKVDIPTIGRRARILTALCRVTLDCLQTKKRLKKIRRWMPNKQ
jgi:hypothetical protein